MTFDPDFSFNPGISDLVLCDSWFRDFRLLTSVTSRLSRYHHFLGKRYDFERQYRESLWILPSHIQLIDDATRALGLEPLTDYSISSWSKDPEWKLRSSPRLDYIQVMTTTQRESLRDFARILREKLPKPPKDSDAVAVLDHLRGYALKAWRSDFVSRLLSELDYAHMNKLFVVHWSLTFSDHGLRRYRLEHSEGKRPWRNWVEFTLKPACHYPEYFSYSRIPALGDQTQRLHFHMLLFTSRVPSHTVDPNLYPGAKGRYREVMSFKELWPYGRNNSPKAVFWTGCAWSAVLHWLWPVRKDRPGVPVQGNRSAVAYYVANYQKRNQSWMETLPMHLRVTSTRRPPFGTALINQELLRLEDRLLLSSAMMPISNMKSGSLIRRLATKLALRRLRASAIDPTTGRPIPGYYERLLTLKPQRSKFATLMSSIQGRPESNPPNAGPFAVSLTEEMLFEAVVYWEKFWDQVSEPLVQVAGRSLPLSSESHVPRSSWE